MRPPLKIGLRGAEPRRRAADAICAARAETTFKGHRVYGSRRWLLYGASGVSRRRALEALWDGMKAAAARWEAIADALQEAADRGAPARRGKAA